MAYTSLKVFSLNIPAKMVPKGLGFKRLYFQAF
jgi:hypothetical protein